MRRWVSRLDPGVRASLVAAAVLAGVSAAQGSEHVAPTLADLLAPERFREAGLALAAVAGGVVGAGRQQHGTARSLWCAGADRAAIVGAVLRPALVAAGGVVAVWWASSALTTALVAGVPRLAASIGVVRVAAWVAMAAGLAGALGALIGFGLGRTWQAVAVIACSSLAFTSDALGLLGSPPAAAVALSPLAAARSFATAGTGSVLRGFGVHRGDTALLGLATLAWLGVLGSWCLRRSLTPQPRRTVPPLVRTVLVGAALALVGYLGPVAARPSVPWQLRPAWRQAEAHQRSSVQVARWWLACRRHPPRRCRAGEQPGGVAANPAALARIDSATAAELPEAFSLTDPTEVVVVLHLPPYRSGRTVVARAAVRLHLRADHHGGYLVASIDGPIVGPAHP